MKTKWILLVLSIFILVAVKSNAGETSGTFQTDIFRIEIGKDYKNYSKDDLQRRVWELERAVFQLQQKVFEIEMSGAAPLQIWSCNITALGTPYIGTGETKAVATANAMESCKAKSSGNGFHCKNPKCEQ